MKNKVGGDDGAMEGSECEIGREGAKEGGREGGREGSCEGQWEGGRDPL